MAQLIISSYNRFAYLYQRYLYYNYVFPFFSTFLLIVGLKSVESDNEYSSQHEYAETNPVIEEFLIEKVSWWVKFIHGPYFNIAVIIISALFLTLLLYVILSFTSKFNMIKSWKFFAIIFLVFAYLLYLMTCYFALESFFIWPDDKIIPVYLCKPADNNKTHHQ